MLYNMSTIRTLNITVLNHLNEAVSRDHISTTPEYKLIFIGSKADRTIIIKLMFD